MSSGVIRWRIQNWRPRRSASVLIKSLIVFYNSRPFANECGQSRNVSADPKEPSRDATGDSAPVRRNYGAKSNWNEIAVLGKLECSNIICRVLIIPTGTERRLPWNFISTFHKFLKIRHRHRQTGGRIIPLPNRVWIFYIDHISRWDNLSVARSHRSASNELFDLTQREAFTSLCGITADPTEDRTDTGIRFQDEGDSEHYSYYR